MAGRLRSGSNSQQTLTATRFPAVISFPKRIRLCWLSSSDAFCANANDVPIAAAAKESDQHARVSPRGPEHAARHQGADFGHVELIGAVTERGIEHPALAEPLLPHHRHHHTL